ncbi:MAG: glyceraldehyde-3-phosphate dehydrogenase [Methanotrichaceae archaeon]|nr:glyceraldehyde-3-phosphate dehydrogenase [Methanotrichaceae archaeon]
MKKNVGFVGFDGTESKRAIAAIHTVKEKEGIGGDINVLLRSPHALARVMLSKQKRLHDVRAFLMDNKYKVGWQNAGAKIEGLYDDFFEQSDLIVVGAPGGEEAPFVEAGIEHDCSIMLIGGANRQEILQDLQEKKVDIPEKANEDFAREFFFGLENYEKFLNAGSKLVQCTSCNTTSICRVAKAAKLLGLRAVMGNLDRRQGDPHNKVRASISAVQFGKGVGHQGTDAGTIFKDIRFSIRAGKIPTTIPHVHNLILAFEEKHELQELVEQLSKTRRIVVIPYEDVGRTHEWTSEILEGFISGFERPISPEIFELLVSDAIISFELGNYIFHQIVMMVEQMSVPVPNYAEAYLMFCGYPADEVHAAVDKDLGCVHGIWPDSLSV